MTGAWEFIKSLHWDMIASFLGSMAILSGLAVWFHKRIIKKFLLDPIAENTAMTREIFKEVKPNGMSSMKDQVTLLVSQTSNIEKRLILAEFNGMKSDGLLKSIFKSIHLGHFVTNQKGEFIEVGSMMCRLFKRSESELEGFNWQSWIHEDDRPRVKADWEDAAATSRDFDIGFRVILPDRKIQNVRMVIFKVAEQNSNFSGFIGTVTTVGKPTELAKAE